ncbi:MAG: hypothetical protein Q9212_004097 [Teloschistes hypoglaucus]
MADKVEKQFELMDWYSKLPTRRVDLVGDYAGQELFIVEGDGLLLRCFDDPKLDLVDGFQLLHAAYAVEQFLQGLIQRKCNFHIVFFDIHHDLCIPRGSPSALKSQYFLARAVIIRHLVVHLPSTRPAVRVHTFSSTLEPDFQEYLKASGAYFVMAHDGANPLPVDKDPRLSERPGLDLDSIEKQELQRRTKFRTTILDLINLGYNIALIDGLEWMDTKIMTMVVEGIRKSVALPKSNDRLSDTQPDGPNTSQNQSDSNIDIPESHLESIMQEASKVRTISERMLIILVALEFMCKQDLAAPKLAVAVLIQMLLVSDLSLSSRCFDTSEMGADDRNQLHGFIGEFAKVAKGLLQNPNWKDTCRRHALTCDITDLIDGRLLAKIWSELNKSPARQVLSDRLQEELETFASIINIQGELTDKLTKRSKHTESEETSSADPGFVDGKKLWILPFSHAVFDQHLKPITVSLQNSKDPSGRSMKVFHEVSHWHNAKRRLDPKASLPLSDWDKKRALRRNQFFMAEMAGYAASLTGVTGKTLEPELITVSEEAKPMKLSKGGSSARAMIDANKASKGGGKADKTLAAWKTVRINLDAERSLQSRFRKTKSYLRDLPDEKKDVLQAEVEYYMICTLLKMYRILSKQSEMESGAQADGVIALIFSMVRELPNARGLTKTIVGQVNTIVRVLKLPDPGFSLVENDRKPSFEADVRLGEIQAIASAHGEFQLLHCGPYMDRNLDSAPDARVKSFNPDGWQRKVLDELDAERSIFVVAPTSAGKTFISFYAMERILRKNDDSVLVYVAPTKALVNQIGAEVQARFKKTYRHAGKSVWAIHTRDMRINQPLNAQVLIVVPHILQIMLLSSSNARSWSKRIKCIIFDEIHCIGQAEDGVVWEQLLLLAPCPIIALSATIGNPGQFNQWLTSTQRSSLTMITHQHRYSDLRKFIYKAPTEFSFNGLPEPSFSILGLDGLQGLTYVHPLASLVNKSRGMPQDLSLEARDCLLLWKSMCKYQTHEYPISEDLNPDRLPPVIRKVDIIEWENKLKTLLKTWMVEEGSPFDKIVADLSKGIENAERPKSYKTRVEEGTVTTKATAVDADDLYSSTLPLLCQLQSRGALPAILFNYDRSKCEGICRAIMKQLKDAEDAFKSSSPAWKAKIRGYEQYLQDKSKHNPTKAPAIKKKGKSNDDEGRSKADKMQDAASEEVNPYANFDADAAVDGFHFANMAKAEASELAAIHKELIRRDLPPWLMESLTRGIGVHHAGMNRKYRQAVEMLFRKGFLRVVIATGTLALGINMPCATVVFSGDSVFLTALNFRQAAGRAGRRGFDLLGNVVFQNITTAKVCRLLSSRLPDLTGHFPVTTTLVLRLFILLHESGNSKFAVDAINSLLSQPRLYLDGPAFKDQVLHHLRFSIEYLRRHDLLNAEGVPLNLAGLTSHLYYTENSSFALNALMKEGYFHELCSDIETAESRVLRDLMIVMAHLFGRRPCRHSDQEYIDEIVKRSPSVVFLPQLPNAAARLLQQHNQQTLRIFSTYVRTFVDQHIDSPDHTLPVTGLSIGGSNDAPAPSFLQPLPSTKIRSPFVALSGHGDDDFSSIADLCRTVRSGVFLEENVIPHLDVYPDETETPLNAYLYDFYMHGDVDALERANGVRKADVWFLLNDFSLVLATIQTSLANLMKIPDTATDMEDLVGGGDEGNNKDEDQFVDSGYVSAASSVHDGPASTTASNSILPDRSSKAKGKKKVEESWEEAADADAQAEEDAAAWDQDDSEDNDEGGPQTAKELEQGFLRIYRSFSRLKEEFDRKFRAMFA